MNLRRGFLSLGLRVGAAVLLMSAIPGRADDVGMHVKEATAITQVFGNGQRLIAVALEYDREIDNSRLSEASFHVEGRTIAKVYANAVASPAEQGKNGKYVIVDLSPSDPDAALYVQDRMTVKRRKAMALAVQSGPVFTAAGERYEASAHAFATQKVVNLIVDDFRQLAYEDPKTGNVLNYNLFVPKNYDKNKSYPLVLFMHDAGVTSSITDTTLVQGLGAVIWASPAEQVKHEAFVLAPQYATQMVNDKSEASSYLDTTVNLIDHLANEFSIDRDRLYTTGQSGGAMMSIAMDIKYPDLFAASFLVAGQWDPAKVQPLANDKLWIVVSEGDLKAYPGQNAITAELEKYGARVSRAVWDGRSTPKEFEAAVQRMPAENNLINYVALRKGTVVPPGQVDDGGSNHVNTWRIAYTIEGIRDWLFKQHR